MAPPDTLLNSLWVPGQVIIDDQRAKLQIYTFGGRFRCKHDACRVPEMLNQRGTNVEGARARRTPGPSVTFNPLFIDLGRFRASVGAVENNNLPAIAVRFKKGLNV